METALKNKNVLISGASIAGPALAYWLCQYGFNVTVIEKAAQLRKGGYRIDVRGAAIGVVERMGLLAAIKNEATVLSNSAIVNGAGKRVVSFDDPNLFGMRKPEDVEIMRGDLATILYEYTHSQARYVFDESITSVAQTAEDVRVTFKSGATEVFDLLIGADGLRSNVRGLVFGDDEQFTRNYGFCIAVFSIPNYLKLKNEELSYISPGKMVNVYNIGDGDDTKVLLIFQADESAINNKDVARQKQLLTDRFKDAGWELPKMLEALQATTDFYFDSISQVAMDSLSKGRTVLLGDAGYCPSPASGQGTSLALVGAYILAGELAVAGSDFPLAFARYEQQMKDFIKVNQALAVNSLKQMVPKSKAQVWMQNRMMRLLLRLPYRDKILKKMLQNIQRTVDNAANGIILKEYDIQDDSKPLQSISSQTEDLAFWKTGTPKAIA